MRFWTDRPARAALRRAALGYAVTRGWDVAPGAFLERRWEGGRPRLDCSCRRARCPGTHPADPDWREQASTCTEDIEAWWAHQPYGIVLPTGSMFEVFDAPAAAGERALRRLAACGVPPGPVAHAPTGRWLFFAAPSGLSFPEVAAATDVRHRGVGDYVLAPPSRLAPHGGYRWACPPTAANRRLPAAWVLAEALAAA